MILVLDNYDSFVHNLARMFRERGAQVEVVRSDRITVDEALALDPTHLVISPGPCTPAEAGISVALIRAIRGRLPILGVCLGHQAVAEAYGGRIVRSPEPIHGRALSVRHLGTGLFSGVPSPFVAGLYHSLSVARDGLPYSLEVEAWTDRGEVMALRHGSHPVWGVQFHPESILTPWGGRILENFLSVSREEPRSGGVVLPGAPALIGVP
jgi:anthranilate synthase/aminodeoxychorismate synthase-like glutamine amidotransferase